MNEVEISPDRSVTALLHELAEGRSEALGEMMRGTLGWGLSQMQGSGVAQG